MREVLRAAGGSAGGAAPTSALPVLLLSNDNAQILAAKVGGRSEQSVL